MNAFYRLFAIGLMVSFVTATVPSQVFAAQSIKAGDLNGRLAAAADPRDKGADPAVKGKEGPLPCNSKNNPKCEPESPSKPGDGKGKGKGKG